MNILFFGGSSFASQDLIVNLSKKNNVYNLSRKKVAGVQNIYFDINSNLSPDGSLLLCPTNAIFEIK